MRTIKFRGLKIDTGEWVFGNLVNVRDGNTSRYYPCIVISYNHDSFDWIEIKPETVGQFTGLLDKNGKEIYEGDIVRYIGNDAGDPFTEEVKYNGAGFDPVCAICWMSDINEAGCEVIGNIHNNPELQKGGEK